MTLPDFMLSVANHLWQSTVFVLLAGLLTLALRKNAASVRYWLWWIASVKFLAPFSLFIGLGQQIEGFRSVAVAEDLQAAAAWRQVTEPLSFAAQPFQPGIETLTVPADSRAPWRDAWPAAVLAVWACGIVALAMRGRRKWRRMRSVMLSGAPTVESRAAQTLRRLEARIGTRHSLSIVPTTVAIEPTVFGVFRPVLLWPASLSARLSDAELEGILLHELAHVRRRDNLTGALHLVVETVFWFYPVVHWLGLRLIEERERTCDEDALRWGGVARDYAEGILKVCEHCIASPLMWAAGITGANLRKRVADVMKNRIGVELTVGRRLLLATALVAAVAGPVSVGALHEMSPPGVVTQRVGQSNSGDATQTSEAFEVASIRPSGPEAPATQGARGLGGGSGAGAAGCVPSSSGYFQQVDPRRLAVGRATLFQLITWAYDDLLVQDAPEFRRPSGSGSAPRCNISEKLITGGPAWVRQDLWDVQASIPEGLFSSRPVANDPRIQQMLRALLSERFKLEMRRSTTQMPVYLLKVGSGGPKFNGQRQPQDGERRMVNLDRDGRPLPTPDGPPPEGAFGVRTARNLGNGMFSGALGATNLSMEGWVRGLNAGPGGLGRLVLDRTGLSGRFDFHYESDTPISITDPVALDRGLANVKRDAIRAMGFELEEAQIPLSVWTIESAERPSGN